MIKIIKHGTQNFCATCSVCGCEFEYDTTDLVGTNINCPECGNRVFHNPRKQYIRGTNMECVPTDSIPTMIDNTIYVGDLLHSATGYITSSN